MKRTVLFLAVLALVVAFVDAIVLAQTSTPSVAEAPALSLGDTWVFKSSTGASQRRKFLKEDKGLLVFEVTHTSPGGKPAPYLFFLTKDLSFVKVMKDDGIEHRRFEPHALGLRFPLHLGKKWNGKTQRFDQGKPGFIFVGNFQVTRIEEIEVAAGKFQSFRVEGQSYPEADPANIFRYIHWYSPAAKAIVKLWEIDPLGNESTFELVKFLPH